jgi:hypothetical protein
MFFPFYKFLQNCVSISHLPEHVNCVVLFVLLELRVYVAKVVKSNILMILLHCLSSDSFFRHICSRNQTKHPNIYVEYINYLPHTTTYEQKRHNFNVIGHLRAVKTSNPTLSISFSIITHSSA